MTELSWQNGDRVADEAAATAAAAVPRLAFEAVGRRFGAADALTDVSLSVRPGEILCLLGPSGCGKTTLLRIAAGVERQTSGRVLIDGAEVGGPEVFLPPEQRQVGLVFQDYALFPHLTVADNVRFGLPRGASAGGAAAEALAAVGLAHHAGSYPHALSGGEQQRVALVRAIAPHPRVLLMDEPFSGLDSRLRERVRQDTLAILRRRGVTAIMVTHDPAEAMAVGDRIALLRAGRLVQIGRPAELFRRPVDLEAARFFSELNEIRGVVAGGRLRLAVGEVPAPGLAEGAAAVVAVRPRDLLVEPDPAGAGRVVSVTFLGEIDALEIEVSGVAGLLVARDWRPGRLAPGARVGVSIAADAALVFPAT